MPLGSDHERVHLAVVWGRRRVGKTALIEQFGRDRPTIFHTAAGRPAEQELRLLSRQVSTLDAGRRDLVARPFHDWDDAMDVLSAIWEQRQVRIVFDEFPELTTTSPELPGVLRAMLDRPSRHTKLLLSGSAVRTMYAMQGVRAPLYGRVDLTLGLHPFRPHEAAAMLADLDPAERAQVWTIVGGVPLYLRWWDTSSDLASNIERLVTRTDGRLLHEGQLVLATEAGSGDLTGPVLRAIATGRTKYSEINDVAKADAARTLERLIELRLIERSVPVTDDARRTRRRVYHIADNFLAFWLGVVDRFRSEIERGLGQTIITSVLATLDAHAGPRWEAAVREHLRRVAITGALGDDIVAVGRWWRDRPEPVEIDAVVLSGADRRPVLAAKAKWTTTVDGRRVASALRRRTTYLPNADNNLRLAIAARKHVTNADDITVITAADIFS
ncbi:MAG: ATP-binding protein [Actinobacteria bacterium]|nr:ATP-binding protein [Actinomycetota bacterium]